MLFQKSFILLGAFGATISATNSNLGCSNCLGHNPDAIRYACYKLCSSALNAASSEFRYCRLTCSGFIFDDNCCTNAGTCSSDPNQCMNTFFPPSSSGKRDLARNASGFEDRSHARDFVPMSGAIAIRDNTDLIETRIDYGAGCCEAVQTVIGTAATKLMPLIMGQRWDQGTFAGVLIISFGLAGAMACNAAFGVSCIFTGAQPAVVGPLAAGPLPVPMIPPPPGIPVRGL